MRRGRRWAWVVSVALSVLNIVIGAALIVLIGVLGIADVESTVDADLSVSLATSVLWALTLGYLVLVRAAFQAHRKAHIGEGTRPKIGRASVRERGCQYV